MTRLLALFLASLFLALAMVGVFVPGLPTVPFLLLAAWFSARGSQRLHRWIYAHPHLGKLLLDWEQHGAVSRRSKITAVVMMALSWMLIYYLSEKVWVVIMVSVVFVCVATFLISRPEPKELD